MKNKPYFFSFIIVLVITGISIGSTVFAHLMVAQKGTLNIHQNGGYLAVSIATSGLDGVDDDGDGLLSPTELATHREAIEEQLKAGLRLSDADGYRPAMEGMMLRLSPEDSSEDDPQEDEPADQLIVMGRFALTDDPEEAYTERPLFFESSLWGTNENEQSIGLTITTELENEQLLVVTPQHPKSKLYKSLFDVIASYLYLGVEHVLIGLDHILFLLVVIAAGLGWKRVFTALSVFTIGHAISLIAVVYGNLHLPANIVEPTIAATIIGLAAYDFWVSRTKRDYSNITRMALIFACSLIHGLGLGGALLELGVNPSQQAATLLGFNVGIEVGQLAAAVVALTIFAIIRNLFGERSVRFVTTTMTLCAVIAGGLWFVERIIQ